MKIGTKLTVLSTVQDAAFCQDGEWRSFDELGISLPVHGVLDAMREGVHMVEIEHDNHLFIIPASDVVYF